MTTQSLFNQMLGVLRPEIEKLGGTFRLSATPENTFAMLTSPPSGDWHCILEWAGYSLRDQTYGTMVGVSFATILQQPRGLSADPAAGVLVEDIAGAPSLIQHLDEVISLVRRFRPAGEVDSHGALLQSADWLEVEGMNVRQIRALFTLGMALD